MDETTWQEMFGEPLGLPLDKLTPPQVNGHQSEIVDTEDLTQDGLALAAGRSGWDENARYVPKWDTWLFWDGERWVKRDWVHAQNKVREFLRNCAAIIQTSDKKMAKVLRSKDMTTAIEILLRSNSASISNVEQWDGNIFLLGTPKGTVDLTTGQLIVARREDYITKFTAVAPEEPGCKHPVWTKFLNDIFAKDQDIIDFMQRAAGWALTGDNTEQKLIFNYGKGRNGKGVFMHTIGSIMNDYSKNVDSSVFISSHFPQHTTELAQMQGARLVDSSEIEKGKSWNGEVLKRLTGGDVISARYMRQDFFEFKPQLSLFISGNNKPSFKGIGTSIRERFLLVPFTQSFTGARSDPDLEKKLVKEWPAILRWMIDGAIDWRAQGLNPPKVILDASADYLDEEDDISRFISTHLEDDPDSKLATSEVYKHFRLWQQAEGVKLTWTQTAMTRALSEEGNCIIKPHTRPTNGGTPVTCVIGKKIKALTYESTLDEARYM